MTTETQKRPPTTGEDQFEQLLMSMLDSDEEGTISMLTSAFVGVLTGLADAETNTVGHDVLVVCGEYEVIIRRSTDAPSQSLH